MRVALSLPFSQERYINHLGRSNFTGLQGPEIYQEIMPYRVRSNLDSLDGDQGRIFGGR